jgi:hypothetical protein
MDRLEGAINRADEAQRLISSPLFDRAFTDTRQALLNTWASLDTVDERYSDFALDLHRKIKALDSVRRCLEQHITSGKVAHKEIEAREKRSSVFRR